jgi:hypothetical protein
MQVMAIEVSALKKIPLLSFRWLYKNKKHNENMCTLENFMTSDSTLVCFSIECRYSVIYVIVVFQKRVTEGEIGKMEHNFPISSHISPLPSTQ